MSGVLKVVGTIAGIVAMIPSPIQPIAAAVAVAANIGAQLTASKPMKFNGSVNGIMIGLDAASPYPMGETYLGGVLRHDTGYGGTVKKIPNPYRGLVIDYAVAGPIHSFTGLYADFAEIGFSGNAATGYFNGFLYADRQLGACPEPAALSPQFAGMPGWGASSKLSGKAAVLWNLKLDKDGKVFASGVPQLGAKLKAVLAYDPRKDSTYPGGSGPHRIGVESTYEWTDNPALHAITYAYGRFQNGIKVMGIGQTLDGLIMPQFVEWANVCEANGWKIGGTVYEPGDRWENLKNILMAGGAEPAFNGGQLGLKINAPKVAVDTITFDDLADDDVSVVGMQTWRARLNGIVPKYRSEAHQWEYVPSALVSVASFVTEDGEPKNEERQWNLVQSKDQVAQLAAYELYNGRELAPIDLVCKPRMRNYGPGTKLIVDLPDYGMAALPCIVVRKSFDPATMKVSLTLMSETEAKHDFALGRTGTAPPTPTITGTEELDDGTDLNGIGRPPAAFDMETLYSYGAVVILPDGSTYMYIHDTPSTGNAPPDPDYWEMLSGPVIPAGFEDLVENFNSRNDRDGSSISGATFPTDGSAVDHNLSQDGSSNIRLKWNWAGTESNIDGFQIMLHKGSTNAPYTPGTAPNDEALWELPASHRVAWSYGFPADAFYAFAVRPYRKVDPDITPGRKIFGPWRQPTITSEAVYQPATEISILPGGAGTIGGLDISDLIEAIGNFDTRNDRDGSAVTVPTISSSGSAIDHSANRNGSVNMSLEWTYAAPAEANIDYFELLVYASDGSSAYTIGTDAANETIIPISRSKRSYSLMGINPTSYYTLAIRAVRVVDPDIESTREIRSAWARPSLTAENPYRPATEPIYYGDHLGTIDGVDASIVAGATVNFNTRNDRDGSAVAQPLLASGGTAIEHTSNTDSSCDIRIAWDWPSGVPEDSIDGYDVLVVSRSSSGTYTIGSDPSIERIHPLVPYTRALVLSGMPADRWYTFAVRARRVVDPDINSTRQLVSAWKRPSAVDNENPYRPSANVAFAGTFSTLPRQVAPGNLTIHRNWKGEIFGGQVPVSMKFQHLKGGTDVSASATWAIEKSFGITVSVGSGGTGGVVTITSVNHLAWFVVASTYEGVTHRHLIETPINFTAPPLGSAPHIVIPEIDGFKVSTTSTPGNLIAQFQVSTGPTGVLEGECTFWGYGVDGDGGIQWQVRYRVAGVGSYVDGPGATQQLYFDPEYPRGTLAGVDVTAVALPGLNLNTLYDIQIYARRSTSVPSVGATEVRAVPAAITWFGK